MRKLSAKEKHIYVTQGLQRQGSYRKDKQHPQAIDLALNMAESRIIKARLIQDTQIPQRFQINQKYASDIQILIKLDVPLPTFKDTLTNKSYGVVPYDFGFLLSDYSTVIEDCQTDFATATEIKSERIIIIPYTCGRTVAPYFETTIAAVGANNITIKGGFQSKQENVYLVDYILDAYRSLGVVPYWETYKDFYYPNSFIIATTDLTTQVGLNVDGASLQNITNVDKPQTVFKALPVGTIAVNRDSKVDFLSSILSSNFHKTTQASPVAVVANNSVVVYGSERFLANTIFLNYIRKPKRINLALNQGSELSPTVHEEICDLAIQLLKKQIEDESYQVEVQDNKGRVE